ncbi:MAG TPA: hypothetical protein VNV17_18325 [Solirubrobacteraceae bacterium]|nr:hypothetical protein [Solirubrobacteraceae bacterium]
MPQSGVAESRGDHGQHDDRVAARNAARAALLEWDARERERERLPSAVRALDDWSSSEPHDTAPSPSSLPGGVAGRRTVTISGRVPDHRYVTPRQNSRRRPERRYERSGFRPDRTALWAVLLGVMLILAAVTSAHAATLHTLAHLH